MNLLVRSNISTSVGILHVFLYKFVNPGAFRSYSLQLKRSCSRLLAFARVYFRSRIHYPWLRVEFTFQMRDTTYFEYCYPTGPEISIYIDKWKLHPLNVRSNKLLQFRKTKSCTTMNLVLFWSLKLLLSKYTIRFILGCFYIYIADGEVKTHFENPINCHTMWKHGKISFTTKSTMDLKIEDFCLQWPPEIDDARFFSWSFYWTLNVRRERMLWFLKFSFKSLVFK